MNTTINTNLRALIFGVTVTAALTVTFDTVVAAEPQQVIRLDRVEVTAHRDAFDVDGTLKVAPGAPASTGGRAVAVE